MDDWSDDELAASVAAYRAMQTMEEAGQKFTKVQVYRDLAERFGRTTKSYEFRMQNISAVLDELGQPWIQGLKPATNVGSGVKPRLVNMLQSAPSPSAPLQGRFKHGGKRTWELALDAVVALGGSAGPQEVLNLVHAAYPDYNSKNLIADLAMLAVNSRSRTSYTPNTHPRRTDQGSQFDRLFKVGSGPGVRFELYDAADHGVWEIYPDAASGNRNGMSVRRVSNAVASGLDQASLEEEQQGAFDVTSVEDARKHVWTAIVRRRGQAGFRKELLRAYESCCAVTGCSVSEVLEAAHIHPYMGSATNVASNGLLLRTDIHTLFDLGLIGVHSGSMTVQVAPQLAGSEYSKLDGKQLIQPANSVDGPSPSALDWHRSRCAW